VITHLKGPILPFDDDARPFFASPFGYFSQKNTKTQCYETSLNCQTFDFNVPQKYFKLLFKLELNILPNILHRA
jgi:hypothetical protein